MAKLNAYNVNADKPNPKYRWKPVEKSDELDEFDEVAYERHGRLDREEEEKEVEGADERILRRTSLPRRTVGGEGERNILPDNTRGGYVFFFLFLRKRTLLFHQCVFVVYFTIFLLGGRFS